MSADLNVEIPSTKLPTAKELLDAVTKAGYDIAVSGEGDLPPRIDVPGSWVVPCTYRGDETCFQLYVRKEKAGLSLFFECHSHAEMTVATILAAMLVKLAGKGTIDDPQTGETAVGAKSALALAKKRDTEYARDSVRTPAKKKTRKPSGALSLEKMQQTLDARLAKTKTPKGRPNVNGRCHRSESLHHAADAICTEFLGNAGFVHDGKGRLSRRINDILQTIEWRCPSYYFTITVAVSFDSALTGKHERYWFSGIVHLMPRPSPIHFYATSDRFEHELAKAHAALAHYGLPILLEHDSMAKVLAGRIAPPQEPGWKNWYMGLAHAHAGNKVKARACFRRIIGKYSVGRQPYFRERASACEEMLEKLGGPTKPKPKQAKAPARKAPTARKKASPARAKKKPQ